MDFSKIKPRTHERVWTARCKRCGAVVKYLCDPVAQRFRHEDWVERDVHMTRCRGYFEVLAVCEEPIPGRAEAEGKAP